MNKDAKPGLLAQFKALLTPKEAPIRFKRFYHGEVFSIIAPDTWGQNASPNNHLSISAPADAAALTASAFQRAEATLAEFAEMRFSAVHDCFKPSGKTERRQAGKMPMVLQEYRGVWPGNREETLYLVVCLQLAPDTYASLTITTTPGEFSRNRSLYEEMLDSVQIASPADP